MRTTCCEVAGRGKAVPVESVRLPYPTPPRGVLMSAHPLHLELFPLPTRKSSRRWAAMLTYFS